MEPVRLAIVGCGTSVSIMYGPILRYLTKGKVVAAVDPDRNKAQWAHDFYGVPEVYESLDEMLSRTRVDAALVASPVFAHRDNVVDLARAGVHVMCEKPMARTIEECDTMAQACQEAGVVLLIAFMKRYNKCFLKATEMIQAGELGDVYQVRAEWSFYHPTLPGPREGNARPNWRSSLGAWGGAFQDHGSHTIDLARWWLGDVESVNGEIRILDRDHRQVEDYVVAMLRHKSGGVSIHHQTHLRQGGHLEYYEISGTRGRLEIFHDLPSPSFISMEPFRMFLWTELSRREEVTPINHPNRDIEQMRNLQYLKELEHFCDCVRNGTAPRTTAAEGRAAIEAITAAYISSWKDRRVCLPLKETPDLEAGFKAMLETP